MMHIFLSPFCLNYNVVVVSVTVATRSKDNGGRREGSMFRVEGKLPDKTGMQARWPQDKQASDGHARTAQSQINQAYV
jgi:hypothetical protein